MEPKIVINDHRISDGAAMTLRVALEHFAIFLSNPNCLGNDTHGYAMREGYTQRIYEIRRVIYNDKTCLTKKSKLHPITSAMTGAAIGRASDEVKGSR